MAFSHRHDRMCKCYSKRQLLHPDERVFSLNKRLVQDGKMNGCDYDHLIKGRERAVVTHGIITLYLLFHILSRRLLNAPFKWFHGARCLFYIYITKYTLSGFKIKMIPNTSTARGACDARSVIRFQNHRRCYGKTHCYPFETFYCEYYDTSEVQSF